MRCCKCGFENLDGMAFCGKCGAGLQAASDNSGEVKCPKCGSMMPSSAAFCGICGCELRDSAVSPPPTASRQPVSPGKPTDNGLAHQPRNSSAAVETPSGKSSDAGAVQESPSESLREMIGIPSGWFAMGSPSDVGHDDEHPRHQVQLSFFYIDRCAVSNLEYERFDPRHRRLRPEIADGDQDPVVFVSHGDCLNYCRWRAEQEGLPPDTYSLPSEAQWERAARGASPERLYPWGDEIIPTHCNTLECDRRRVMPIDAATPNDMGLFYMGSNVREWCLDYYAADYYGSTEAAGPDPRELRQTMLVTMNVVRGASFRDKAAELGRCAARNYAHPNSSSSDIGFRCVRMKR
ncbi:MAG: SUMF1/EgtB/PvdO family nonheme iron enzyme [Planctomycetota bacterium]